MKEEDAEFCLSFKRDKIPFSNMEKTTIEIESGHLPDEFIYAIGELIKKHNKPAELFWPHSRRSSNLYIERLPMPSLIDKIKNDGYNKPHKEGYPDISTIGELVMPKPPKE
jgi:hypothetical protein